METVFKAYRYMSLLWLEAKGENNTTGWENRFETTENSGEYKFIQTCDSDLVLQVIVPFVVVCPFPDPGNDKVVIDSDGKRIEVVVADASPFEQAMLMGSVAAEAIDIEKLVKTGIGTEAPKETVKHKLLSFDIPFGCATLQNPLRAKRIKVFAEASGPSAEEAKKAIEECLKQGALAAALAALATPAWALAFAAFRASFVACVTARLGGAFRVRVFTEESCV